MFSGTAVAQLVNLCSYPFLARLYTPADFGVFTIFLTTAAIFGALACGRYDVVIQAAKNFETFAVFKASQLMNCAVSLAVTAGFLAYSVLLQGAIGLTQSVLLGLVVLLTGYCNATSLLLLKQEDYKHNTASSIIRTFLTAIPQVALFFLFPSANGLILGLFIGNLMQGAYLLYVVRLAMKWRRTTPRQLKYVLCRYKRYLQYDVPSNLVASLTLHLMNYCLLFLYTATEVGFYSVSYRLAALPLALFSNSLSQVFFQKASKSYRETGLFWSELRFNLYSSAAVSLAIFIPVIFVVKPVISFYLGSAWLPAAEMLICLTPLLVFRFISVSIAVVPLIVGEPQVLLVNNLALLFAIVTSFAAAKFYSLSMLNYLLLNSLAGALVYLVFIWYIVAQTRCRYRTVQQGSYYEHA